MKPNKQFLFSGFLFIGMITFTSTVIAAVMPTEFSTDAVVVSPEPPAYTTATVAQEIPIPVSTSAVEAAMGTPAGPSYVYAPVSPSGSTCIDEAFIELLPYLGIDFTRSHMKSRASYGGLLPSSFFGGSLYAGVKFHPNLGFELGYDWSMKRSSNWTLGQTQVMFGSVVRTTFSGQTKVRRSGAHLDVVGFLPVWECLESMVFLGVGWIQPKVESIMSITPGAAEPNSSAIASITGDSRGVLRLGVGLRYMLTDLFGIRGKLGYETSSRLRVSGNSYFQRLGYSTRPFSNSLSLSIGAFYKF